MKVVIVVVIYTLFAVSCVQANFKADLARYADVCLPQSKVNPKDLDKFLGQGMRAEDANEAVKCHLLCILEQRGHYKNGHLDEDHALKAIKTNAALNDLQDALVAALNVCKNVKGDNTCDESFKILMCFKDTEAGKLALARY